MNLRSTHEGDEKTELTTSACGRTEPIAAYVGVRLLVVGADGQFNGKFGLPLEFPGLLRLSYE